MLNYREPVKVRQPCPNTGQRQILNETPNFLSAPAGVMLPLATWYTGQSRQQGRISFLVGGAFLPRYDITESIFYQSRRQQITVWPHPGLVTQWPHPGLTVQPTDDGKQHMLSEAQKYQMNMHNEKKCQKWHLYETNCFHKLHRTLIWGITFLRFQSHFEHSETKQYILPPITLTGHPLQPSYCTQQAGSPHSGHFMFLQTAAFLYQIFYEEIHVRKYAMHKRAHTQYTHTHNTHTHR